MNKDKVYELLRSANDPADYGRYFYEPEFKSMHQILQERKYTVSETGVPYRVINHWENKKIMPDGAKDQQGWRKFTLVELAWLRIVQRLRDFGFSLQKIRDTKEQIINWNKKTEVYPFFEFALAQACFTDKDIYLVIYPTENMSNRNAYLLFSEEIEMEKLIYGYKDMVLISLKSIAIELGLTAPDAQKKLGLSEEEIELLDKIRNTKAKEVTAHLRDKKIERISLKSVEEQPEKLFEILRKQLDSSSNQTITIKKQDDKVLFIQQDQHEKILKNRK
jgi:hypothetical protein